MLAKQALFGALERLEKKRKKEATTTYGLQILFHLKSKRKQQIRFFSVLNEKEAA